VPPGALGLSALEHHAVGNGDQHVVIRLSDRHMFDEMEVAPAAGQHLLNFPDQDRFWGRTGTSDELCEY
jgi:hypothetical protein